MTTTPHSTLTGTELHEPKGADTAAVDKVYVSDGAGSGTWQKLTADQLTTTGNAFGAQLLHLEDQKTSGTDGGAAFTGGWYPRIFNTTLTNEISGASIGSNTYDITLPAGTYYINALCPFFGAGNFGVRLQNITDATTLLLGTSGAASASVTAHSLLIGRFTLSGTKILEVQYRASSAGTTGLGGASGFQTEVYSNLQIWKLA